MKTVICLLLAELGWPTKPAPKAEKSAFDKATLEAYLRNLELYLPSVKAKVDDAQPPKRSPDSSMCGCTGWRRQRVQGRAGVDPKTGKPSSSNTFFFFSFFFFFFFFFFWGGGGGGGGSLEYVLLSPRFLEFHISWPKGSTPLVGTRHPQPASY